MKINSNNYEEFMISYLEGELDEVQQLELVRFLETHPELKADLDLFKQTVLHPDTSVVFENKEELKKKESGRVIPLMAFVKYSAAVAALLLLFIGIRLLNQPQVSADKYATQHTGNTTIAFTRKTEDRTNENNPSKEKNTTTTNDQENKNLFLANTRDGEVKPDHGKGNQLPPVIRPADISTETVAFAQASSITMKQNRQHLKSSNGEFILDGNYSMASNEEKQPAKITSAIADKFNDALAVADNLGNMLGITKSRPGENDEVRTTNIKLFDLEYYNRRNINNSEKN